MELSRDFKVNNYTVVEKISSTKEHITYKAVKDGMETKLCEFYPEEMVTRYISGELSVNYGRENDYEALMNKFSSAAKNAKSAGFKEFIRIDEIFEENKTCYFSYEESQGQYLLAHVAGRGGKINYREAYDLLTPFVSVLTSSFEQGIYYRSDVNDMIVNTEGKLALNSVFKPEYTVQYCIEDIANIYYTLLTGKQYVQCLVKPSQIGAILPERLDNLIYEALYTNSPYTTIEEFYKNITEAAMLNVDGGAMVQPAATPVQPAMPSAPVTGGEYVQPAQGAMGTYNQAPQPNMYQNPDMYQKPPKSNTGKIVAGCAAVGCLVLILVPVLLFAVGRSVASKAGNDLSYITSEAIWDSEEFEYDEDYDYSIYYMYETYTYSSLENSDYVFNDTIIEDNNNIYYRSYEQNWLLIKEEKATGLKTALAEDILPTFMDVSGDTLYYADGFDDYHIYAVNINSGEVQKVLDVRSSYLKVYDGRIYFSNLEDWCSLYSVTLDGSDLTKHTKYESEYITVLDGDIYYMDLDDNYNIRAFNPASQSDRLIDTESADNLIARNGKLYFIDYETGNVRSWSPDGDEEVFETNAYVFDIYENIIYYSDNDDLFIHAYNMDTHEDVQLSDTIDALYLKVAGGKLYCYMYYEEDLVRYDMNTGDFEYIFEGMPDYDAYYY